MVAVVPAPLPLPSFPPVSFLLLPLLSAVSYSSGWPASQPAGLAFPPASRTCLLASWLAGWLLQTPRGTRLPLPPPPALRLPGALAERGGRGECSRRQRVLLACLLHGGASLARLSIGLTASRGSNVLFPPPTHTFLPPPTPPLSGGAWFKY